MNNEVIVCLFLECHKRRNDEDPLEHFKTERKITTIIVSGKSKFSRQYILHCAELGWGSTSNVLMFVLY